MNDADVAIMLLGRFQYLYSPSPIYIPLFILLSHIITERTPGVLLSVIYSVADKTIHV